MDINRIRVIITKLSSVIRFSTKSDIPKDNLGRWTLKSPDQVEHFMTQMHADPGYYFLHNKGKSF
jgi:hypothetical protein